MDKMKNMMTSTPDTLKCEEIYEMEEIIGEGTFSSVVRGIHNDSKEPFAIKIIDKTKMESPKQLLRVYNEIAIHKRAKHPYIVNYIEHYETDIDVCIIMELCHGGELFNRIVEKGNFSEKEASIALRQILKAVEYLHSMGIVHRDIKPENLLYTGNSSDANSVVKLADFGLCKQLEVASGRNLLKASMSGTPAYCAPERLNMEVESKAVDMWSVGCILYFLLYGVPPFYSVKEDEDEQEDEIFDSILEGSVKFPDNKAISDAAQDLILRLLEKEPSDRITADQALKHPFIRNYHSSSKSANPNSNTNPIHVESNGTSTVVGQSVGLEDISQMQQTHNSVSSSSSTTSTSSSSSFCLSSETLITSERVSLKQSINRIIDVQSSFETDNTDEDLEECCDD